MKTFSCLKASEKETNENVFNNNQKGDGCVNSLGGGGGEYFHNVYIYQIITLYIWNILQLSMPFTPQ